MMTWEAKKRPSAREMLSHPWIRGDGVAADNPIEPEVLHRLRSFANMNAFKKHTLVVSVQDEVAWSALAAVQSSGPTLSCICAIW